MNVTEPDKVETSNEWNEVGQWVGNKDKVERSSGKSRMLGLSGSDDGAQAILGKIDKKLK